MALEDTRMASGCEASVFLLLQRVQHNGITQTANAMNALFSGILQTRDILEQY